MTRAHLFTLESYQSSCRTWKCALCVKGWSFELHLLHPSGWTLSSCLARNELDDLPPILILVKTEGLGCLSPLNLRHTEVLRVLTIPILLNIEGCCYDASGCNLSNTDDFELDVALSPSSSLISYSNNILSEWLLVLISSLNFHKLRWYVAKPNLCYHDFASLSLYYFLHVIEPIRLCFNDVT